MANVDQDPGEMVSAQAVLSGPDWKLDVQIAVSTGPTRLRQLLPMVQSLADAVVQAAVRTAAEEGRKISCSKGCGACCRQLVPISTTEARHIADVVHDLPEPRRTFVHERFAKARLKLENVGLLEKLESPERWQPGDGQSLGLQYFRQGIPCLFLEEEACSIHADRPIACREYLVTSPPVYCARPTNDPVQGVQLPLKVWTALARFDKGRPDASTLRWVPLILAPDWAVTHPDESAPRPGPELVRKLFDHLTAGKGASLPV